MLKSLIDFVVVMAALLSQHVFALQNTNLPANRAVCIGNSNFNIFSERLG